MSRHKSRVHPTYKTKYRVGNWPAYDRSLVERGSVTLWLSPKAIEAWTPAPTGRRGGPWKFSNLAIETALTLRLVFHLPLRQAEGFTNSGFSVDSDGQAPSQRMRGPIRDAGRDGAAGALT